MQIELTVLESRKITRDGFRVEQLEARKTYSLPEYIAYSFAPNHYTLLLESARKLREVAHAN